MRVCVLIVPAFCWMVMSGCDENSGAPKQADASIPAQPENKRSQGELRKSKTRSRGRKARASSTPETFLSERRNIAISVARSGPVKSVKRRKTAATSVVSQEELIKKESNIESEEEREVNSEDEVSSPPVDSEETPTLLEQLSPVVEEESLTDEIDASPEQSDTSSVVSSDKEGSSISDPVKVESSQLGSSSVLSKHTISSVPDKVASTESFKSALLKKRGEIVAKKDLVPENRRKRRGELATAVLDGNRRLYLQVIDSLQKDRDRYWINVIQVLVHVSRFVKFIATEWDSNNNIAGMTHTKKEVITDLVDVLISACDVNSDAKTVDAGPLFKSIDSFLLNSLDSHLKGLNNLAKLIGSLNWALRMPLQTVAIENSNEDKSNSSSNDSGWGDEESVLKQTSLGKYDYNPIKIINPLLETLTHPTLVGQTIDIRENMRPPVVAFMPIPVYPHISFSAYQHKYKLIGIISQKTLLTKTETESYVVDPSANVFIHVNPNGEIDRTRDAKDFESILTQTFKSNQKNAVLVYVLTSGED